MFKKLVSDMEDTQRPKVSFQNKTAMSEIKKRNTVDRINKRVDIIEKKH